MTSNRTNRIMQQAKLIYQTESNSVGVSDHSSFLSDTETYEMVIENVANEQLLPSVYQANVLENPVSVEMGSIIIIPNTFPENNILIEENINMSEQMHYENSSGEHVLSELSKVVLDNGEIFAGTNSLEVESSCIETHHQNKGFSEHYPDDASGTIKTKVINYREENIEDLHSNNSDESDNENDDPDYQTTVDYINAETNFNEKNSDIEEEAEDENSGNIYELETEYTKKGVLRKRKKYKLSVTARKEKHRNEKKRNHKVLEGCGENCKKHCMQNITHKRRIDINKQFWNMNRHDQKNFVIGCIIISGVKRKTVGEDSRRTMTSTYYFKNEERKSICVCKTFFLTTLGYKKSNDKILENLFEKNKSLVTPKKDRRLGLSPPNKKNHDRITEHIESFKPNISHYRREHAPLRRYLPSDMSAVLLFEDFNARNPNFCSYDLYRSILRKRNISFVKLGHEECEQCEHFNLHEHSKDDLSLDCNTCEKWQIHIKKAESARIYYRTDAEKSYSVDEIIFSVDLQKVIMLPRCDMFKTVLFTGRLVAFNESFVPVGKKNKNLMPTAVIWHEAIRGRKKEEIISTFYKFFLEHRDITKIVLWVDNCTAQNKNWAFLCFLIYIVNSPDINAKEIVVNYFEPGHTFMSADSFHHQVEQSMKKCNKVYDFDDFKRAVSNANSSRVTVLEMELQDSYEWKDFSSKFKLKQEKVYLHDIVQIVAERGKMSLLYKNNYEGQPLQLNFINSKVMKTGIPKPNQQIGHRGISRERRDGIVNLIKGNNSIIPINRLMFWENIPVMSENIDSDNENDF